MGDLHIYRVKLPYGINEMIMPDDDGYTIYIDSELDENDAKKSLCHALNHIKFNDFEKNIVNEIEFENHGEVSIDEFNLLIDVKFIENPNL